MPIQSFLQRLIWACVLPLFVFAAGMAWLTLSHQAQDQALAGERAARSLLLRIDAYVQARLDALQVLARSPVQANPASLAAHFDEARAFQGAFGSHVIVTDPEGRMLLNTRVPPGTPLPALPVPEGPTAVRGALATGRPAVGSLVPGPVAGQPVVPLVAPVLRDGQAVQLLLSTLERRELQALLDTTDLPDFADLELRDGNGQLMAARAAATRRAASVAAASAAPAESHAGDLTLRSGLTAWSLAVRLDRAALRAQLLRTGLALAAALGTALLLTAWAARRAGRELAHEVSSLAAGPADMPGQAGGRILEVQLARQRLDTVTAGRARAEAEVRENHSRLLQLLGGLREAVWITLDHRIDFANPAAERQVGVSASHMSGRLITDFMQTESVERAGPLLQRVRAGETDVLFEDMRFVDPDAPPRTLLVTGVTLALPGGQATLMIARDVSELHVTRAALERSNRELVRMVDRLNHVEEEERRRIARELHDDLQQRLGVIAMEQQQAARALPQPAPASAAALERAQSMTTASIDSLRRIVRSLRPQALDELGLAAALETLLREWGEQTGLQAECEVLGGEGADAALPLATASALYRVTQEALANVSKHAQASFVHVVLDLSRSGHATLQVSDDGRGLPYMTLPGQYAFGIRGMRERLQALGGELEVDLAPGGGTRVLAKVAWPAGLGDHGRPLGGLN